MQPKQTFNLNKNNDIQTILHVFFSLHWYILLRYMGLFIFKSVFFFKYLERDQFRALSKTLHFRTVKKLNVENKTIPTKMFRFMNNKWNVRCPKKNFFESNDFLFKKLFIAENLIDRFKFINSNSNNWKLTFKL